MDRSSREFAIGQLELVGIPQEEKVKHWSKLYFGLRLVRRDFEERQIGARSLINYARKRLDETGSKSTEDVNG
jgi:hypothetical protein